MLTTSAINKLIPQEKNYDVKDTPYLYLRVYSTGTKKWIFQKRINVSPYMLSILYVVDFSVCD